MGIETYRPANNRSQITATDKNTLICDFYNANPSSMAVALENLQNATESNKAFILGDMFELGEEAEAEHKEIMQKALAINAQRSIFIGEEFYKLKESAPVNAEFYRTTTDAFEALKNEPPKGISYFDQRIAGNEIRRPD